MSTRREPGRGLSIGNFQTVQANIEQYMLEVIGAGNPDYKGQDWGELWANSPENRLLLDEINNIKRTRRRKRNAAKNKKDSEFAASQWTQIKTVTRRAFVSYWRTPEYTMVCGIGLRY